MIPEEFIVCPPNVINLFWHGLVSEHGCRVTFSVYGRLALLSYINIEVDTKIAHVVEQQERLIFWHPEIRSLAMYIDRPRLVSRSDLNSRKSIFIFAVPGVESKDQNWRKFGF